MTTFYKFCSNINGAIKRRQVSVTVPNSTLVYEIIMLLINDGFVRSVINVEAKNQKQTKLIVNLAYFKDKPVLKQILPVSKPGRKVFSTFRALKLLKIRIFSRNKQDFLKKNKYIKILISTNKGILTENQAINNHVGGIIICKIFA